MNIYCLLFTIYNNNSNINTKTLNHITNAPTCFRCFCTIFWVLWCCVCWNYKIL